MSMPTMGLREPPREAIGCGSGGGVGQGASRTGQSGKVAHGKRPHRPAGRRRAQLPLCTALERARHRAQDAGALELMSATDAKLLNRAQERRGRLGGCAMKPSDLARVVIDTTVQPKAVMFPG